MAGDLETHPNMALMSQQFRDVVGTNGVKCSHRWRCLGGFEAVA